MGFHLAFVLLLILGVLSNSFELAADVLYRARSVGTLNAKKSEARSLNQQGAVAGKVWVGKNTINDFLWIPKENKIRYLTTEAHPKSFPLLNNKNEVAGFIYNVKTPMFQIHPNVYTVPYIYDPVSGSEKKGNEILVGRVSKLPILNLLTPEPDVYYLKAFNDKGERFFNDASDINKATASVAYVEKSPYLITSKYISSMNNHSEALVTFDNGLSALDFKFFKHELIIMNSEEKVVEIVAKKALFGIALSDNRHVIAMNKEGSEGFFWSQADPSEEKLISLGSLIPIALNNHGDVIGKLYAPSDSDPSFWLRTIDGTMIELNTAIDFEGLNVEKITDMWAINDAGQILISAIVNGSPHALLLYRK